MQSSAKPNNHFLYATTSRLTGRRIVIVHGTTLAQDHQQGTKLRKLATRMFSPPTSGGGK